MGTPAADRSRCRRRQIRLSQAQLTRRQHSKTNRALASDEATKPERQSTCRRHPQLGFVAWDALIDAIDSHSELPGLAVDHDGSMLAKRIDVDLVTSDEPAPVGERLR
jgi:hypothetical protein